MTASAYRSIEVVLHERTASLCVDRAAHAPRLAKVTRVAARRIGKAVGGAVAVLLGATAFVVAISTLPAPEDDGSRDVATVLLLGAWPAAVVAGTIGCGLAQRLASARFAQRAFPPQTVADLLRLEARDPLRQAKALAARWEVASTALPVAAVSLLAPLTIHWLAWQALLLGQGESGSPADFGSWIALSVVIVGHAHVALAVAGVRWAYSLRSCETCQLRAGLNRSWTAALLVAIGMACVPGVVLLALPPVVVWVTGLAFVPMMYRVSARWLELERRIIEAT